jgi:flagellar biosynthetic protein FliQ
MQLEDVQKIAEQMVWISLLVSAPLLGISLASGLVVSIFQALTQIHEMGLVFIFKIVTVAIVLIVFMPWLLTQLSDYTITIFSDIVTYSR